MKIALLLIALVGAQVHGLSMPIEDDNEARAPERPHPDTIAGCSGANAITNCDKCYNPDLQCNECKGGFYRTLDWLRCLACPSDCLECTDSNADDVTECLKCKDSFYKTSEKKCDKCNGHCASCTARDQCATCDPRYHMLDTGAGSQRKCLTCASFCKRCDDSGANACRECNKGYFLTALKPPSSCTACVSGCAECKDGQSCDKCQAGKTFNSASKTCTNCIANCAVCDTAAGCTKCNTGYSLANDKSKCHDCTNCAGCPETGGCTACNYGFILQDSACYTCPAVDTVAVCSSCGRSDDTRGRFLDAATTTCKYCPENSASCTTATSGVTCADGKYFASPSCVDCDASCVTCSAAGAAGCTACAAGQFVSGGPPGTCTACGANCAACTSATVCTECSSGFYLDPNDASNCVSCPASDADLDKNIDACIQCSVTSTSGKTFDTTKGCTGTCPTNCLLCTDATSCDLCDSANTWDPSTSTCTTTGGVTDLYENSAGDKLKCAAGKWWDGSTCAATTSDGSTAGSSDAVYKTDGTDNIQYCIQATVTTTGAEITDCTNDASLDANGHYGTGDVLIGCEVGYTIDAAGTACTACSSAYTVTADTCSQCLGGFWEGTCTACTTDCTECTLTSGAMSCTTCAEGKYADTTCKDVSCGSVDTQAECTLCAIDTRGTYWSGSACITCPEGCLTCTSATTCTACVPGKSFNSGKNKCIDCDYDDAIQCSNCGSATYGRYYDSATTKCLNCPVGCKMCADNAGTVECSECFATYYLDQSTLLCTACPASPTTADMCSACKGAAFYWDDTATTCTACPTNCLDCNAAASCTKCASGKYFDPADTTKCSSCVSGCTSCTSGTSCTTCTSGKYFDGTSCATCPTNCMTCETSGGCTKCNSGYYLIAGAMTGTCAACSSAISNCVTCNSATNCQNCGSGRYFKADTNECAACIANCQTCTDGTTCSVCSSGYCLDADANECRSNAGTSCSTCTLNSDSEVTCLSCPSAHHLEICTACTKANCIQCNADKAECEKCAGGYYLEGISCVQCPGAANCLECTGASSCSKCRTGYFFDATAVTCSACPSGCSSCTSATNCAKCSSSAAFFDSTAVKCQSCMAGCKSCTKTDECAECMMGYAPIKTASKITECRVCPAGCKMCHMSGENPVCDECHDSYFMKKDMSCELCSASFAMCSECDDANNNDQIETGECMECSGGTLKDDDTACLACSTISGCKECEDLPTLCLQCAADFYPTEDLEECHPGCYHCSSEDNENCKDNVSSNNTYIEACPGIGTMASCIASQIGDGEEAIYKRYCGKNDTCPEPGNEICQTAMEQKECKICCLEPLCNTMVTTGENSGVVSIYYQKSLVSVMMAAVVVLFLAM